MELQMNSVKGPRGVQLDDVCAAADAVLNRGERPTIERIRLQLGRGSPNTVGPMLDSWYATLAKRLKSSGEMNVAAGDAGASPGANASSEGGLPPSVLRAAQTLWGRAQQVASERVEAANAAQRLELAQEATELQSQREQFEAQKQRLDERAAAIEAAMLAKDQQIAQLSRQLEEHRHMLQGRAEETEMLRSDLSKQRIAMDAMRQFTQVKDEEHRKERERIEERATAQERRLLSEVDRARQNAKHAESQLDAAQKQAAKQLAEAEIRQQDLDGELATAQQENARLSKEILAAKDALQRSEAKSRADADAEPAHRPQKLRAKSPAIVRKTRLKRSP